MPRIQTQHESSCPCSGGLVPLTAQAPAIQGLARQVSAEDDLAELLASATAAQQTVQTLAQRQAAALEDVTQELLASPEILRCGKGSRTVSSLARITMHSQGPCIKIGRGEELCSAVAYRRASF